MCPRCGAVRRPATVNSKVMSLSEFRGLTPDVRAGLVPAPCGATTRVARTLRNLQEPKLFANEPLIEIEGLTDVSGVVGFVGGDDRKYFGDGEDAAATVPPFFQPIIFLDGF